MDSSTEGHSLRGPAERLPAVGWDGLGCRSPSQDLRLTFSSLQALAHVEAYIDFSEDDNLEEGVLSQGEPAHPLLLCPSVFVFIFVFTLPLSVSPTHPPLFLACFSKINNAI